MSTTHDAAVGMHVDAHLNFTTVGTTLERAARLHGDRTAIVMDGVRVTHADVLAHARRFARALAGQGVQPGDHVGILMPNCLDYLWLSYGCALLGASPVHLNARYKRDELRYVVADSDIRLLFTTTLQREFTDFTQLLTDVYPTLAHWRAGAVLDLPEAPLLRGVFRFHDVAPGADADLGAHWPGEQAFLAAATASDPTVERDPERIGLIMYTSGTTANPKACLLSHRALEAAGALMVKRWHIGADDRIWDPLPYFHMSTMLPLAATRATGACFIGVPHFEVNAAWPEIVAERPTIMFTAFPAITNEIFAHPEFDAAKLAAVRVMNNVGPPDLLRRYMSLLPQAVHVSAYGLTETGGVNSFHELTDTVEQRIETCGRPFDGIEVRVVDPDTLARLPAETRGELQVRGATLFSGYYKDAEKTRATILPDGWLRTGDLGALTPEGRIRYLGRIKDMLKVGGENVAAIEIESHLLTHPAIKVAQVIGAPDERMQEVPAAFIELQPGATLTAEDVVRHCVGRIASWKVPRHVAFVTDWPMSTTKIQKFALRERLVDAVSVDPKRLG
jgi:acyl-CoA synthetase (AMP-forming)/AMP-acid ligase II